MSKATALICRRASSVMAGSSSKDAIALDDSDTEDEQLSAVAMARTRQQEGQQVLEGKEDEEDKEQGAEKKKPEISHAIPGLGDRAQMERERLERQRKRRREAGLPEEEEDGDRNTSASASKASRLNSDDVASSGPSKHRAGALLPRGSKLTSIGTHSYAEAPMFWNGCILKSFNQYSTSAPGTRFEEFLRPTTPFRANGLKHAIIATYCEDIQWLSSMFPKGSAAPSITMLTLASHGMRPGVYSPLHPQLPNWVRLVIPRPGFSEYTTMHMKFLMLFYEDRLRLLILSGNLLEYDWSRIENTAFIHDFPKRPAASSPDRSPAPYETQMRAVLQSLSVPSGHAAMRDMSLYEMKSDCEARLVASLPTAKPTLGWPDIEKVGIGRLAKMAYEILGKRTNVTIEAQGSSMGNYSPRWLQQFHIACQGGAYNEHLPLPPGDKAQRAWAQATRCSEQNKWPPVKLLFPSDRWVKTQAIEGVAGAGTFFGKSQQAVDRGFVDQMYQPESTRAPVMMHHKAILVLRDDEEGGRSVADENKGNIVIGWAYMGSHNLTQAAWGNISAAKGNNRQVQMSSSNWELGLIVPVRQRDLLASQSRDVVNNNNNDNASLAASIITWKRPVQRYRPGDIPFEQARQG